jgi:hypothetical protein
MQGVTLKWRRLKTERRGWNPRKQNSEGGIHERKSRLSTSTAPLVLNHFILILTFLFLTSYSSSLLSTTGRRAGITQGYGEVEARHHRR